MKSEEDVDSEERKFLDKMKETYAKTAHDKDLHLLKECSICGKKNVTVIWDHETSWICLECFSKQKKEGKP